MNELQQIFDGCQVLYEKCFNNVKEMSCAIASLMEMEDREWNPKITTGKFDIVLQYSLLQIAVADFDFDRNELIFIRDITKQADFVDYINSVAESNITWDSLYNSSVLDIRKVLRGLEGHMESLSNEFVNVFAALDKATTYDYVADLEANIILIIAGLANMDGTVTKSELEEDCLIIRAINRIKELKK